MEEFRYKHAKSAWMSAIESFEIARGLAETGVDEGNIDAFMMAGSYRVYVEDVGAPPAGTSNFLTLVPLTFSVINGIELAIKAYQYAGHPDVAPRTMPKLPELIKQFKADFPQEGLFGAFIDKYTNEAAMPALLARFLQENKLTALEFTGARRYLNNTNFFTVIEKYGPVFFTPGEGKAYFTELIADLKPVLARLAVLEADIDSEGVPGSLIQALRA